MSNVYKLSKCFYLNKVCLENDNINAYFSRITIKKKINFVKAGIV